MNQHSYHQHQYAIAGITAVLLWSTTIAFSRSLTEQLGTFNAAALIYLLAGVFGLAFMFAKSPGAILQMFRLPSLYLWGCGFLFVVYICALYLAVGASINREQVLAVGLINYLWPGLSLVFSIPILGKRPLPWLPVGIITALIGVWLAMTGGDTSSQQQVRALFDEGSFLPYALALVAAVAWGLYTNLSRRWGGETGQGAVPLFLLASGLVLGAFRLITPEESTWGISTGLELVYLALFPGMLAYVLWDLAVRKGSIIFAASFSYLTPLLSTIVSAIVLAVLPGPGVWAGAILVISGAVICKYAILDEAPK
jgi:drug/metabolite transporter (DMT)-like permease